MLYVYTCFSQIGYVNYPQLSEALHAYFGLAVFEHYLYFVWASFLCLFLVLVLVAPRLNATRVIHVQLRPPSFAAAVTLTFCVHAVEGYFLILYRDLVDYVAIAGDDYAADHGPGVVLWIMLFKYGTLLNIAVYCAFRQSRGTHGRALLGFLFATGLGTCLTTAYHTGNRTDVLILTIGVAMFEFSQTFTERSLPRMKTVVAVGTLLVLGVIFMQRVEGARGSTNDGVSMVEQLISKDFYAPSHVLIGAIAHDYVDIGEVAKSNACNALVLLNFPLLQYHITELINPGVTTRKAGYAFYVFTEGYLALGNCGFLYNGLVVGAGLAFWRLWSCTNSKAFNSFALALTTAMLANMARGQTSYFIKYSYMCFLPATALYCALNGIQVRFTRLSRGRLQDVSRKSALPHNTAHGGLTTGMGAIHGQHRGVSVRR
jgi:hypothetical protein